MLWKYYKSVVNLTFLKINKPMSHTKFNRYMETKFQNMIWDSESFLFFLFSFIENQDQESIMANLKIAYLNDHHTSVFVDPLLLSPLLCSLKNERGDTKGLRERGMVLATELSVTQYMRQWGRAWKKVAYDIINMPTWLNSV